MRISDWSSDVCSSDLLGDVHTRLTLYKRIASARSEDDLRDLQVEMIDRFGLLPEPTKQFFAVASLKLMARSEERREGKRVSVWVDPGGCRILKKKIQNE